MQTPDLPVQDNHKPRRASELLAAMSPVVARGDVRTAELLVREAERDHAGDASLVLMVSRCKTLIQRGRWLAAALETMRQDLEEDRFSAAVGHFREALGVSRGMAVLKEAADLQAAREAEKLLPQNWRVAETILHESATTEPFFEADADLKAKLKKAREDEILSNSIYQADRIGIEGRTDQARRLLMDLLAVHPSDSRIKDRLDALDHPERPVATATPVYASAGTGSSQVLRPPDSELDTEGSPNEKPNGVLKAWRTKVLIPNSAWNTVKNFAALVAATSMLGLAGFLVWQHFSRPSIKAGTALAATHYGVNVPTDSVKSPQAKPVGEVRRVAVKTEEAPDEEAWELVKTTEDTSIIRAFLNTYPTSSHALRAKVKLEEMDWEKVDKSKKEDLGKYLRAHPDSRHKAEALKLLADSKSKDTADDQ